MEGSWHEALARRLLDGPVPQVSFDSVQRRWMAEPDGGPKCVEISQAVAILEQWEGVHVAWKVSSARE